MRLNQSRNGETALRAARKLSKPTANLYLATTHFHPEQAAGAQAFPASIIVIRPRAQRNLLWKPPASQLTAEFKAKYPDSGNVTGIPNAVRRVYEEGK